MKKLFLSLLVTLCAVCALFGVAACGEMTGYNISVSCGDGGEYSLSHENPVPENTQVTLTVTPDDGYTVGDVLIDNSKVSLVGNKYIFTVTKDISISISFESENAAPEECTITVDCGAGGDYELSPASDYHVGDRVTLTLTPNAGYRASEVKVNGRAVTLRGNTYEWTLTGDTTVEIAFAPVAYTVAVYCGYGGNYELSKQAPYSYGDEVTLTVTSNENHNVKSVTVNGEDVTEELADGEYTFTVSANAEIVISFSAVVSRDAYVGTWTSIASAGTLSDELVIGEDSFTFNEKVYSLTETEDGYSFTVTEGSDVYHYSFTLEEVGEEKYILVLTVVTSETTLTEYCTKEGVDYSVAFPETLQGDWGTDSPADYPINIGENRMTIGSDTATVLFYNAQTTTYTLLSGGIEYTLVWNEDEETLTLTIVGEASSAVVYTKSLPPEEAFFPQFAGNYYTNGEHNVQIGDDGAFSFDGTTYSVIPVDPSEPKFGYTFRRNGDLWHIITATAEQFLLNDADYSDEIVCRRVTGEEAYTITVTYTGGENGTCTVTPPAKGGTTYSAYELVTVTITANTGYHLQQVYLNGGSDITEEFADGSYTFYISRNTTIEIKFVSEQVAESIFPTDFIDRVFYAEDLNVFSVQFGYDRVTLTIESVQYVFTVEEITVTDSTSATFTFHVTIEKYGVVTVQCARQYGFANFTVSKADGTVLGRTFTDKKVT